MKIYIKCSGCSKRVSTDLCEAFDGVSDKGVVFKKQLCPACVKDIVNEFREHIKAKEGAHETLV